MKNPIFLFVFLFLLSGCAGGGNLITEENAPVNLNNYDNAGYINDLNAVKNGAVPKIAPDKKPLSPPPMQNNQTQSSAKDVRLKDLASQYGYAVLKTNLGDIKLSLYAAESPTTVNNFLNLAEQGFYDGTRFHRVIKDFMIQGGDPLSKDESQRARWGTGGPDYRFGDEINERPLQRGSLAMANSGPNTNGSQFFIVTADFTPWLDGKHTNFGFVEEGMDVVEKIEAARTGQNDQPIEDVIIKSIELRP